MSYLDQPTMSPRKVTALTVAAILHVLIIVALLLGGTKYIKHVATKLTVLDITPPPPPPPLPPPPPPPPAPPQQQQSPPVVSPPTIVPVPSPPVQVQAVPTAPPAPPTPIAAAPAPVPVPAPPAPPAIATPIKVKGDPNSWFTDDDYPDEAKRENIVGKLRVHLVVDATGKVSDCQVTSGSGSSALDQTACRLLIRRGRFYPAKDPQGHAISAPYDFGFTWKLQD